MREFVGVLSSMDTIMRLSPLKEAALIFDRLALPGPTSNLLLANSLGEPGLLERPAEVEWLIQNGVIFETALVDILGPTLSEFKMPKGEVDGYLSGMAELEKITDELANYNSSKTAPLKEGDRLRFIELLNKLENDPKDRQTILDLREMASRWPLVKYLFSGQIEVMRMALHQVRCISAGLRKIRNMDAYPVLPTNVMGQPGDELPKSDVVQISLNALPLAIESVPWEEILEYRNEADIEGKFSGFRHWMTEIARCKLAPTEIEEKLDYLLFEYQRHLNLHRIKTERGTIETVLVASAETLENLVKFKWSKIARGLFTLKHRRIALMESELTAPGNEIAYIFATRKKLNML